MRKKANLSHIWHTYNFHLQKDDEKIYQIATQKERIIITQDNDFKKWIKPKQAGVFMIPSYLSNQQIDDLLSNFIVDKDPQNYMGKVTKLI